MFNIRQLSQRLFYLPPHTFSSATEISTHIFLSNLVVPIYSFVYAFFIYKRLQLLQWIILQVYNRFILALAALNNFTSFSQEQIVHYGNQRHSAWLSCNRQRGRLNKN